MTKIQVECDRCHKKVWTPAIKVYVFKQRYCNECQSALKRNMEDINKLYCPKCHREWDVRSVEISRLKLEMKGTTRDFMKAEEKRRQGLEVEKVNVPKNRMCQRCRNLQSRFGNLLKNQRRKRAKEVGTRVIPKEEVDDIIRREIRELHRKEIVKRREEEKKARISKRGESENP